MAKKRHQNAALLTLVTSAFSLPGISAKAEGVPDFTSVKYRYTSYVEDNAPERFTVEGDVGRYKIQANQIQLVQPVGERASITFDYLSETMSGASPWGVKQGADNQPELIMSGASIKEERQDVAVRLKVYDKESSVSFMGGHSTENDYKAVYGGLENELHFNQKNTTVKSGLKVSIDRINPTQEEGQSRISEEEKNSTSYSVGLAQVLNPSAIVQVGLEYAQLSGYLTDPYKLQDSRPDIRKQTIASLGYRQFITSTDSAFHLDYRSYTDDWKVKSHTINVAWYQNFGSRHVIVPSIRLYSQKKAKFYGVYFEGDETTEYFSSDYRLSSYEAMSYKLKYIKYFDTWSFTVAGERYESEGSSGETENPALVSFTRWTVGFDIKFD